MTFLYHLIDFLTLFNVVQSVLMYIVYLLSYLMSNIADYAYEAIPEKQR